VSLLSSVFGAAVRTRNALYDNGTLPVRRLQQPVISVGNISVGGAGKTPFLMMLGDLLRGRGIEFDVLSRGYRRRTKGVAVVDPAGLPVEFGDEPLLIARRMDVPVIVGEDRYEAGVLAEERFPGRWHLLDDAFQHRGLARDFDVVLVTPDDARDRLLPSGRLREPISALKRADAVVLSNGAKPEDFPAARRIWRVRRGIVPQDVPPEPVAFCGIARPRQFFRQLKIAGVTPAAEVLFRDHHTYTEQDIASLLSIRDQNQAQGFVTTEKDAINLGIFLPALRPLAVVPVRMELENATEAMDAMLAEIAARRAS
jgi:tetraacyldisaccharide 4'-kinase